MLQTKKARTWLLGLGLWLGAGLAWAGVDVPTATWLMAQSGVTLQLQSLSPQLVQGIKERFDAQQLPPAAGEQVAAVASQAFAPNRLVPKGLQVYVQRTDPQHLPALQAWYRSPAGEQIKQAEDRSAVEASAGDDAYMQSAMALLQTVEPDRRALLDQLSEALQLPENSTKIMLTNLQAMGLAAEQTGLGRALTAAEQAAVVEVVSQQRGQMLQAMEMMLPALLAKTYEPVSQPVLQSYVRFLRSAAGQHLNTVAMAALEAALQEGGRGYGEGLAALLQTR